MPPAGNQYEEAYRAYWTGDYGTAYRLLIGFAEAGDAEAQTAIGTMYQLGLGGLQMDEALAAKWYTLASAQGNGVASNNLGTLALQRGDRAAAAQWYLKARKQGFPHSPKLPLPGE